MTGGASLLDSLLWCYLAGMTFAELIEMVRRDIIVDRFEDAVTNDALRDVLWQASVELAAAFDLPRQIIMVPVALNDLAIPLPNARAVSSLSINGDDAQSVDLQVLFRVRPLGPRPVRYFNFDLKRGSEVLISPPSQGGTAIIETTVLLARPDPGDFDASSPWTTSEDVTVLPEFHHAIAYRAGLVLYQMDERQEEAGWLQQEYQNRVSELAAVLGRTDVANLVIPAEARNDEGARG